MYQYIIHGLVTDFMHLAELHVNFYPILDSLRIGCLQLHTRKCTNVSSAKGPCSKEMNHLPTNNFQVISWFSGGI